MQVRPRASSVIVHDVADGDAERFIVWQQAITAAAAAFEGYQDTDVYPPSEAGSRHWVVVVHFDDAAALARWIASPSRSEHVRRYAREFAGHPFQVKTLDKGLGHYFAQVGPPAWKMMATVLLGLYPTVILLSAVVGPHTTSFGFALSMLVGNALSVCVLEWAVMPALIRTLRPWHTTRSPRGSALGFACVLGAIAALAVLFRRLYG